jgi:hypothetical protein
MQQAGEHEPFIDEILRTLHRITVDLAPQQVCRFDIIVLTTGPYVLRGGWIHDLGPTEQANAGKVDREINGAAKQCCERLR